MQYCLVGEAARAEGFAHGQAIQNEIPDRESHGKFHARASEIEANGVEEKCDAVFLAIGGGAGAWKEGEAEPDDYYEEGVNLRESVACYSFDSFIINITLVFFFISVPQIFMYYYWECVEYNAWYKKLNEKHPSRNKLAFLRSNILLCCFWIKLFLIFFIIFLAVIDSRNVIHEIEVADSIDPG